MTSHDLIMTIGLLIGGVLALLGLFRPFLGLVVLIALHFTQPGEFVPALDYVHFERTYGVLLLVAFFAYRVSRSEPSLLSNRVIFACIPLVGAATASIPFAIWRGGAFWQTTVLIKYVILMVLIVGLVDTNGRMRKVLWLLMGLLVWFAGSGLTAYLQGKTVFGEGLERAAGVNSMVGGPNELGGLILALVPFVVALFRCSRRMSVRLVLLACAGLALSTLVITGSRTSMLGLVAVALYFVLRSRHKLVAIGLLVVLAFAVWLGMPQRFRARYLTVRDYAQGGELDASNEFRIRIWKAGWRMFLDHPILGVGAGQFPTAYGRIYSGRAHGAWMNPHNLLLQVGCEMGVVGLVAFGYFFTQILKQIRLVPRADRKSLLELNYQVAVACEAMLLGLVAASVVGHTLYRPYWYLLGGLVAANYSLAQRTGSSPLAAETGKGLEESEAREFRHALPSFLGEKKR